MSPGDTWTVNVRFMSARPITNAHVLIRGPLSHIAIVQPTGFAHVAPRTPYTVTLTVAVPSGAPPGHIGGALAIGAAGHLFRDPLPVRILITDTVAIHSQD
jgi:hypothetical protein